MKNTILIIDDDLDLSEIIQSLLEYSGYNVFVAHTAKEGFDLATKQNPDLIIMDMMMPQMDGAEAVRELRTTYSQKNTPILFLTGLVSETDHLSELQIDDENYTIIAKPFKNELLLNEIKKTLQ